MRQRAAAVVAVGLGLTALLGGCAAASDKAVDKVLEDTEIEIDGLGSKIPASFPDEVPLPTAGASLESAVAAGELYTMRYSVTDPKAATDAYRDALVSAGFSMDTEFDNLASDANNVGFIATNGTWSVTSSAFGPDAADGLYEAVIVQPQS